eukprot:4049334-Alexandrium_andersonii.AAC.1
MAKEKVARTVPTTTTTSATSRIASASSAARRETWLRIAAVAARMDARSTRCRRPSARLEFVGDS